MGRDRGLVRRVLDWYAAHRRELPWRRTRDPYAIWVSEVMLQQTRVEAVLPYYQRILGRFPNVGALASASDEEVLPLWSGLGYYRRARMLHRLARELAATTGTLPRSAAELAELPGVGPYTAAAVASLAFGEAIPVLDGNVQRVASRVLAFAGDPVVDLDALAAALREGHLAGAAIDVYPEEPEVNSGGFGSVLRGLPNVVLTPHIGGSTEEAQEAIGREVSLALTKFVNSGATTGAVNFPQLELPQARGTHRILNVHRNVPGVIRDITRIISDVGANIHAQMLATDADIGYLIMDLDQDLSHEVKKAVAALDTSIKTRMLY